MRENCDDLAELNERTSRLLDEAIDLMIRYQSGGDHAVLRQAIDAWRGRSPEHERIWRRVTEAHDLSGMALASAAKPGQMSRRNLLAAGVALFGAGAAGLLEGPRLRLHLLADHITSKAELLPVQLPDGSQITLGPDSAMATPSDGNLRELRLLQGMAWFDVVKNPSRPFSLHMADGIVVRTADAAFELSSDAGILSLAVARGEVELQGRASHRITQGGWLRIDPSTGLAQQGSRDPAMAGAWREGIIVAEAEPLGSLVARIARWLPGRVVFASPGISASRISGLFDISDPDRALAAAIRPTGARIRQAPGFLTVISSV